MSEYPKFFLKNKDGNWHPRKADDAQEESQARAEGFKTAEELWGEKSKGKSK